MIKTWCIRATLAAVVLCLGACSNGNDRGKAANLPPFQPNVATWRMPFDVYLPDLFTDQYASNLLYGECMSAAGARSVVVDPTVGQSPTLNPRGRRLFNLHLARLYGYQGGPPTKAQPALPRLTGRDAVEDRRCSAEASKKIGFTFDQNQIQGDGLSAAAATDSDPSVVNAVARWRRCMLPLGIPDLAPLPVEQPSQSQKAKFRELSKEHPGIPSLEELREAVFDAKCRASSRYSLTAYKVEASKENKFIATDPELFVRALQERMQQELAVRRVLARHGR